ncbi:hypothetical protein RSOLAG22IIIB_10372 [Rhizoctonia solani]|uniref:Uncharacterized protein n=1 Tax=Rhizoctonia solani TaxID=456999 RepID=A0A0K6G3C1_9AGAM|nr:hypothetical protein RSOLAG22IIIB_10372 [Rhizoctonia solani]
MFMRFVPTWLERASPGWLQLRGISFEELPRVLYRLYSLGIETRIRYDWDHESRTAVLRMPTTIHERVGAFPAREDADFIDRGLERLSICGYPSVAPTGSPDLLIGDNGSTLCPDQCPRLMQQDADGQLVYVQDTPRVIVETSASESRSHVMAKVLSCLHEISGLHAAIVCDMKNVPPSTIQDVKSGPKRAKPFKAEIAVWTRKTVGLLDPGPCYHREELGDHKVGDTVSFTGGLVREQSHIGPSARAYFRPDPKDSNRQQYIFRRSEKWIVVHDESIPAVPGQQQPVLLLNAYDVLCPCRMLISLLTPFYLSPDGIGSAPERSGNAKWLSVRSGSLREFRKSTLKMA